jgi:hypothetical protein
VRENIFTLTRREQRAIIAIVLALLTGTLVKHYRSLRTPMPIPAAVQPSPTPDEAEAAPTETPTQ